MTPHTKFDVEKYKYALKTASNKYKQSFEVIGNRPRVAGSFTDWRPQEMMHIIDY